MMAPSASKRRMPRLFLRSPSFLVARPFTTLAVSALLVMFNFHRGVTAVTNAKTEKSPGGVLDSTAPATAAAPSSNVEVEDVHDEELHPDHELYHRHFHPPVDPLPGATKGSKVNVEIEAATAGGGSTGSTRPEKKHVPNGRTATKKKHKNPDDDIIPARVFGPEQEIDEEIENFESVNSMTKSSTKSKKSAATVVVSPSSKRQTEERQGQSTTKQEQQQSKSVKTKKSDVEELLHQDPAASSSLELKQKTPMLRREKFKQGPSSDSSVNSDTALRLAILHTADTYNMDPGPVAHVQRAFYLGEDASSVLAELSGSSHGGSLASDLHGQIFDHCKGRIRGVTCFPGILQKIGMQEIDLTTKEGRDEMMEAGVFSFGCSNDYASGAFTGTNFASAKTLQDEQSVKRMHRRTPMGGLYEIRKAFLRYRQYFEQLPGFEVLALGGGGFLDNGVVSSADSGRSMIQLWNSAKLDATLIVPESDAIARADGCETDVSCDSTLQRMRESNFAYVHTLFDHKIGDQAYAADLRWRLKHIEAKDVNLNIWGTNATNLAARKRVSSNVLVKAVERYPTQSLRMTSRAIPTGEKRGFYETESKNTMLKTGSTNDYDSNSYPAASTPSNLLNFNPFEDVHQEQHAVTTGSGNSKSAKMLTSSTGRGSGTIDAINDPAAAEKTAQRPLVDQGRDGALDIEDVEDDSSATGRSSSGGAAFSSSSSPLGTSTTTKNRLSDVLDPDDPEDVSDNANAEVLESSSNVRDEFVGKACVFPYNDREMRERNTLEFDPPLSASLSFHPDPLRELKRLLQNYNLAGHYGSAYDDASSHSNQREQTGDAATSSANQTDSTSAANFRSAAADDKRRVGHCAAVIILTSQSIEADLLLWASLTSSGYRVDQILGAGMSVPVLLKLPYTLAQQSRTASRMTAAFADTSEEERFTILWRPGPQAVGVFTWNMNEAQPEAAKMVFLPEGGCDGSLNFFGNQENTGTSGASSTLLRSATLAEEYPPVSPADEANIKITNLQGEDTDFTVADLRTWELPIRWFGLVDLYNIGHWETHYMNFMTDAAREGMQADVAFFFPGKDIPNLFGWVPEEEDLYSDGLNCRGEIAGYASLQGIRDMQAADDPESVDYNNFANPGGRAASDRNDGGLLNTGGQNSYFPGSSAGGGASGISSSSDLSSSLPNCKDLKRQPKKINAKDLYDQFDSKKLDIVRVSAVELIALTLEKLSESDSSSMGQKQFRSLHVQSGIEVTYCGDNFGRPGCDHNMDMCEKCDESLKEETETDYLDREDMYASEEEKAMWAAEMSSKVLKISKMLQTEEMTSGEQDNAADIGRGPRNRNMKQSSASTNDRVHQDLRDFRPTDRPVAQQVVASAQLHPGGGAQNAPSQRTLDDSYDHDVYEDHNPYEEPLADNLFYDSERHEAHLSASEVGRAGLQNEDAPVTGTTSTTGEKIDKAEYDRFHHEVRGVKRIVFVGGQHIRGTRHYRRKTMNACQDWATKWETTFLRGNFKSGKRFCPLCGDTSKSFTTVDDLNELVDQVCGFFEVRLILWDQRRGVLPDVTEFLRRHQNVRLRKFADRIQYMNLFSLAITNSMNEVVRLFIKKVFLEHAYDVPLQQLGEAAADPAVKEFLYSQQEWVSTLRFSNACRGWGSSSSGTSPAASYTTSSKKAVDQSDKLLNTEADEFARRLRAGVDSTSRDHNQGNSGSSAGSPSKVTLGDLSAQNAQLLLRAQQFNPEQLSHVCKKFAFLQQQQRRRALLYELRAKLNEELALYSALLASVDLGPDVVQMFPRWLPSWPRDATVRARSMPEVLVKFFAPVQTQIVASDDLPWNPDALRYPNLRAKIGRAHIQELLLQEQEGAAGGQAGAAASSFLQEKAVGSYNVAQPPPGFSAGMEEQNSEQLGARVPAPEPDIYPLRSRESSVASILQDDLEQITFAFSLLSAEVKSLALDKFTAQIEYLRKVALKKPQKFNQEAIKDWTSWICPEHDYYDGRTSGQRAAPGVRARAGQGGTKSTSTGGAAGARGEPSTGQGQHSGLYQLQTEPVLQIDDFVFCTGWRRFDENDQNFEYKNAYDRESMKKAASSTTSLSSASSPVKVKEHASVYLARHMSSILDMANRLFEERNADVASGGAASDMNSAVKNDQAIFEKLEKNALQMLESLGRQTTVNPENQAFRYRWRPVDASRWFFHQWSSGAWLTHTLYDGSHKVADYEEVNERREDRMIVLALVFLLFGILLMIAATRNINIVRDPDSLGVLTEDPGGVFQQLMSNFVTNIVTLMPADTHKDDMDFIEHGHLSDIEIQGYNSNSSGGITSTLSEPMSDTSGRGAPAAGGTATSSSNKQGSSRNERSQQNTQNKNSLSTKSSSRKQLSMRALESKKKNYQAQTKDAGAAAQQKADDRGDEGEVLDVGAEDGRIFRNYETSSAGAKILNGNNKKVLNRAGREGSSGSLLRRDNGPSVASRGASSVDDPRGTEISKASIISADGDKERLGILRGPSDRNLPTVTSDGTAAAAQQEQTKVRGLSIGRRTAMSRAEKSRQTSASNEEEEEILNEGDVHLDSEITNQKAQTNPGAPPGGGGAASSSSSSFRFYQEAEEQTRKNYVSNRPRAQQRRSNDLQQRMEMNKPPWNHHDYVDDLDDDDSFFPSLRDVFQTAPAPADRHKGEQRSISVVEDDNRKKYIRSRSPPMAAAKRFFHIGTPHDQDQSGIQLEDVRGTRTSSSGDKKDVARRGSTSAAALVPGRQPKEHEKNDSSQEEDDLVFGQESGILFKNDPQDRHQDRSVLFGLLSPIPMENSPAAGAGAASALVQLGDHDEDDDDLEQNMNSTSAPGGVVERTGAPLAAGNRRSERGDVVEDPAGSSAPNAGEQQQEKIYDPTAQPRHTTRRTSSNYPRRGGASRTIFPILKNSGEEHREEVVGSSTSNRSVQSGSDGRPGGGRGEITDENQGTNSNRHEGDDHIV
ncbi:unnamed protein product [Amoebophrya sp. A120]|nr:unnamed protein product [Amoebophrya sp. A120]|eukprot:GSA120T00019289001.1